MYPTTSVLRLHVTMHTNSSKRADPYFVIIAACFAVGAVNTSQDIMRQRIRLYSVYNTSITN